MKNGGCEWSSCDQPALVAVLTNQAESVVLRGRFCVGHAAIAAGIAREEAAGVWLDWAQRHRKAKPVKLRVPSQSS